MMTVPATADDRGSSHDASPRALAASTRTISVDANGCGDWEITLPVHADPINCESLDQARREAYRLAAHWHPCEIVTLDAYHRVVYRKSIDGYGDAAAYPGNYHAGPEMCL
jgi:hypothetical protein